MTGLLALFCPKLNPNTQQIRPILSVKEALCDPNTSKEEFLSQLELNPSAAESMFEEFINAFEDPELDSQVRIFVMDIISHIYDKSQSSELTPIIKKHSTKTARALQKIILKNTSTEEIMLP